MIATILIKKPLTEIAIKNKIHKIILTAHAKLILRMKNNSNYSAYSG